MEIQLILKTLPFSINAYYYRTGVRTKEARLWAQDIFRQLHATVNLEKMKSVREYFDPNKHFLELDLIHYYPEDRFFNKKGAISARVMDLTNVEKPLQDLLTSSRYFERVVPEGVENLCLNDVAIASLSSKNRPTKASEPSIHIRVRVCLLDALEWQNTAFPGEGV